MPIGFLLLIPVAIGLCALLGAYATEQVPDAFISTVKFVFGATVGMFCITIFLRVLAGAANAGAQVFGNLKYVPHTMQISGSASVRATSWKSIRMRRVHCDEVEYGANGAIIAYRYFELLEDGTLASVGKGATRPTNPITNRPAWSYRGGWNISDRVPTLNNTSGIYAAKHARSHILETYAKEGTVLAKVELSGRIIEAEYGYRAQRCRVLEILEG